MHIHQSQHHNDPSECPTNKPLLQEHSVSRLHDRTPNEDIVVDVVSSSMLVAYRPYSRHQDDGISVATQASEAHVNDVNQTASTLFWLFQSGVENATRGMDIVRHSSPSSNERYIPKQKRNRHSIR